MEGENGIRADIAATKSTSMGMQGKSNLFNSQVSAIELAGFSLSDLPISIVPKENSKTDRTARLGVDKFGLRELVNLEPNLGDQLTVFFVREALKEQCIDVIAAPI